MSIANVSDKLKQVINQHADATVAYHQAAADLAKAQAQVVKQGLKEGVLMPQDLGSVGKR